MRPPVLLANDISPYQKPRRRFGASVRERIAIYARVLLQKIKRLIVRM